MRPLLALAFVSLSLGCADDSTGRARVRFATRARAVDASFTTSRGWSLTVTEARLSLGTLRWYEGPALFALRWWERALGVSVAQAHPGHYAPGEALADMTTPRVIPLSATPVELAMADGVTGAAQSAHLELRPAPAGDELNGASLSVRGEAVNGAQRVSFRGALAITLNLEGVSAPGAVDAAAWELQVSVGRWLDRVDFSALTPATPGAEVVFGDDSQASNALYRGASSVGSYRLQRIATQDGGT